MSAPDDLVANYSKVAYTDYFPVDKMATTTPYTGSFTVTAYDGGTFTPGTGSATVTHNLNKKCFPELLWSTDGVNYVPAPQEDTNRVAALAACGLNDCYIYGYQAAGTSSKTVYYILYLLWPN